MVNSIEKVAKVVLGESKGFSPNGKQSLQQAVPKMIKYKKECFKTSQLGKNVENWEKYWSNRTKSFEKFYQTLETKNRE